jgi:thiol-disulfide isomerase/thioredoxin
MIFGVKIKKRQDVKKSSFDIAWSYTSANEGKDSSYDQLTKWGITAGFISFHKLTPKMSVSKVSETQAKTWVKEVISDKIFNKADRIADQSIYNLIIDFGFNKPSICIKYLGIALDKQTDIPQAIESLKIPDSWIIEINRLIIENAAAVLYVSLWKQWWKYIIDSGHFKQGAAGLAMRCWRYKDYGSVGSREQKDAVEAALEESTNDEVRAALKSYLNPPTKNTKKNKFYSNMVPERKILFFTQPGCRPCLALKPTCEALARQYGFGFDEINIRTDSGKRLMTEYRIGATPEVVLIHETTTVSFGAASLQNDGLALYLATLPDPDPFEDGKPRPTDGATTPPASNGGSWLIPTALGAWFFLRKPKESIGVMDTNQKTMVGIGSALLLLWLMSKKSSTTGGLSAQELNAILEKSLENEGPWEPETAHTRKDKGNFHRGAGQYLGTSWGITADFLEDWYGTTQFEADSIRKISKEEAKKIITETVMTRARIAQIQDKWIAAFFFDWMWQRPGTCLEYVCTIIN